MALQYDPVYFHRCASAFESGESSVMMLKLYEFWFNSFHRL